MLRQIYEKAYEHNINLYNLYIDYQDTFDSVDRTQMINDLMVLGIPSKLLRLTNGTLGGYKAAVRVNSNQLTCSFDINTSVGQGDAPSTVLFNLTLETVVVLELSGCTRIKFTHTLIPLTVL